MVLQILLRLLNFVGFLVVLWLVEQRFYRAYTVSDLLRGVYSLLCHSTGERRRISALRHGV